MPLSVHAKSAQGFTLIELVVFIVILGIAIAGVLITLSATLTKTPTAHRQFILAQLAQERMQLILAQRRLNGYSGTDICVASPGLPACLLTAWPGFTVNSSTTVANISGDTNYTLYTVNAADSGSLNSIQLQLVVGNY